MCLRFFYSYKCGARTSLFDENHFFWHGDKGLIGEATAHVDDNNIAGKVDFRTWLRDQLEARFGKVAKQELPMTHVGIVYERFLDGFRLQQKEYALQLKKIEISRERAKQDQAACTDKEKHDLHVGIGGLLFLCYTRLDLVCDTLVLQSHVKNAVVADLKLHNSTVQRAHKDADMGLVFRKLRRPTCIAGVADASGSSSKSSYALEGKCVLRKEDSLVWPDDGVNGEMPGSFWNGKAHMLLHNGKKAKRVSQSTSHAESLAHLSVSMDCELLAMRFTEMCSPAPMTLFKMMEVDLDGGYDVAIDLMTDCNDLFELLVGQKGVPQDKTQRLVIMALRERRLLQKVRCTLKVTDRDMLANPLTKHVAYQFVFDHFMKTGELVLQDRMLFRKARKVADFDETDLVSLWCGTHLGQLD